ncbi:siphovirus ReqiPepy6 Gp37-like family protein [Bacillus sp. Bva_UNVM-123]|uniref:siphovirus ReqiPepy6 Gp37-like family protein n=1 Tax=Bacillus sp. Bva_UNVM-123 TaxID=2829798 RepID=UPI00391F3992
MSIKSPMEIPNLLAWFDASTLDLQDGDAVERWDDAGGGEITLSAPAGKAPIYKSMGLKNKPAVVFNGTSQELLGSFPNTSQDSTIFIVYESITTTANQCLFGTVGHRLYHVTNSTSWTGLWNANSYSNLGRVFTGVQIGTWAWKWNTRIDYYRNQGHVGTQALALTGAGTYRDFAIGSNKENTHYFNGKISEIIIFPSRIPEADKIQIEEYLHQKWLVDDKLPAALVNVKGLTVGNGSGENGGVVKPLGRLTRGGTAGNGDWNAYGALREKFNSNENRYIEFTVPASYLQKTFVVGLQPTSKGVGWNPDTDYQWYVYWGLMRAINQVTKEQRDFTDKPRTADIRYGVGILNKRAVWYINDQLFMTSSNELPDDTEYTCYIFLFDQATYIENLKTGTPPSKEMQTELIKWSGGAYWQETENNGMYKASGAPTGWTSGGNSHPGQYLDGPAVIEFIYPGAGQYCIGVSDLSKDFYNKNYGAVHFNLRVSGSYWYINEGTTTTQASSSTAVQGDIFKIIISKDQVCYFRNDVLLRVSNRAVTFPLYVESTISSNSTASGTIPASLTFEGVKISKQVPFKEHNVELLTHLSKLTANAAAGKEHTRIASSFKSKIKSNLLKEINKCLVTHVKPINSKLRIYTNNNKVAKTSYAKIIGTSAKAVLDKFIVNTPIGQKYRKSIRILSPSMEMLAEIDDYESLMFTRSWNGIGDFDMSINRYKNYTEYLQEGNLILVGAQMNKVFIILHQEIELDENGKATENLLIKGYHLKVVISEKITLPPVHTAYDKKSGTAEEVMKHYVNNNVVNPIDSNRRRHEVVLAANQNRGANVSWQSRFKNLAEEIVEISLITGLGWNVLLDWENKKWIFEVQDGRDLTADQNILPPVIFSPQFESIQSLQYVKSKLNYRNVAYVAGQGEGVDRRVIVVGDVTGAIRREVFIDARDVAEETEDDPPKQRPEKDIIKDLTDRGNQKLQDFLQEEYLEGQILTHSTFVYEEDYDLGDIVTVQNIDWGVTLNARITEIKEIYETNGFRIEAVFGNNRPTLIKKIKQELAQMGGEVRR